jgi:phage-related protein
LCQPRGQPHIVVVHVFAKKTRKTPRSEIKHALKKAKEVQ